MADIPDKQADLVDLPKSLNPDLINALRSMGRTRLYSHQRATIEEVQAGHDVAPVTSTASGKTLGFNAAVLDGLIGKDGRALYLYPLNALANDQRVALTELVDRLPSACRPRIGLATGQSSTNERRAARDADIVLTNPEMLHFSILRNPRLWRGLLGYLRFVVVDEAHLYRGAFGAHMAHLMRRLIRLAAAAGSSPRFILASATIGNPAELAQMLTRREYVVVSRDGAAKAQKQVIVWEPPSYVDSEGNRRYLSYEDEAVQLLSAALRAGRSAILFVRSRRSVESVTAAVKEVLADRPDLSSAVAPYRGGYSPTERKTIEGGLRSGAIRGVISTVALEAGIDIGSLDVVIIGGYPGTMMSFWQQAGRAGRRDRAAQVFYVPSSNPLDAYFAMAPMRLLDTPHEIATFDMWNPNIAALHTLWSANETGLPPKGPWESPVQGDLARRLIERGAIERRGDRDWTVGEVDYEVSLRAIEGRPYKIVDGDGRDVGEQDQDYLLRECHPGAIYVHRGGAFRVGSLDHEARVVNVSRLKAWETETKVEMEPELEVIETIAERRIGPGDGWLISLVRFEVTERYTGYVESERRGGKLVASVRFPKPLTKSQETTGIMLELPTSIGEPSSHAIEHVVLAMVPTQIMSDRNEFFGRSEGSVVSLYERHREGLGFAEKLYERLEEVLGAAAERLADCPCMTGCPRCVHSPACERWNEDLAKGPASAGLDDALGIIRERSTPRATVPRRTSKTTAQVAAEVGREIADEQRRAGIQTLRPSRAATPEIWVLDTTPTAGLRQGTNVRHRAFGVGMVISYDPQRKIVDVSFDNDGRKLIAAGQGHLEVRSD